ncbi:hypothetical protein [Nocardioides sp. LML1-1-1.1]|uniref:hypothetical protein n=1 Tax=Nocardioides sp. LML1-1-1.1 TaxID=3135248 RepID=UPI00342D23E4
MDDGLTTTPWFMIAQRGLARPTPEILEALFPSLVEERFVIRRPILDDPVPELLDGSFRDGTPVSWQEAKRLIVLQLRDPYRVNCELRSPRSVRLHVGEECFYVQGLPEPPGPWASDVDVRLVRASPWQLEDDEWTVADFPVADGAFIERAAASLGSSGAWVLVSWAAGLFGETWHWIADGNSLARLHRTLRPRDVVVVFGPDLTARLPCAPSSLPGAFPAELDGSLSLVAPRPDGARGDGVWIPLDVETYEELIAWAAPGTFLVARPPRRAEHAPPVAAYPDPDGVMRRIGRWV